jgi:flagellar basal-body rod modification protein FlgD
MSAIASNPLASQTPSSAASTTGTSQASSANDLSTEFLQLLIAQLQNQDPSNPTDGTTFVTQLATFTDVQEQTQSTIDLGNILNVIQAADPTAATSANANGTSASSGTNSSNNNSGNGLSATGL